MSTDPAARHRAIEARQHLNIFISLTEETGEGPAVAVKDNVHVRGTVTTAGGTILTPEAQDHDAPVISRIRRNGCFVIGKTNMSEWALGTTSENSHYGPVRNPHDESLVAGGSSGGSAAAVAAGLCDWAIGSDTGGSIRIPASLCGVVGLMPTQGAVAMDGVIPVSETLDTLGPLAPDVSTAARALEMMSELDGLMAEAPPDLADIKLGAPAGWVTGLDVDTARVWDDLRVREVPFPDLSVLGTLGGRILVAEASAYHAKWLGDQPERYGPDVRARLMEGTRISAVEYLTALKERPLAMESADRDMQGLDALIVPATPRVAPRVGEGAGPVELSVFTRPFNTTGQPVICVPVPGSGLPVGIQVVGRIGREASLVAVARALEKGFHGRKEVG